MSVHDVTKIWIEQLPAGHAMIGREQLEQSSLPDLLVRWVEQGVASRIRQSLGLPDIPLARMDEDEVREAWNTFQSTVVRHWALPADEMASLLDELGGDLLALIARPAEKIPDLLFGSESSIDREVLASRLDRVVVHEDLARALLRYAERKELGTIDRELAGRVIAQVDQKLKEHYNADSWAAQLSALFELWGGTVPSGRIRYLLQARGADRATRIPDGTQRRSMEWVVEQLRDEYDTEQWASSSLSVSGSSNTGKSDEEESTARAERIPDKKPPSSLSELYGSTADEQEAATDEAEENSDGDDLSLHRRFQFDEPDMNRYLEEKEVEPEEDSDPFGMETVDHSPVSIYAEPEEESGEPEEAGDENAIWKKFLAPEEDMDSAASTSGTSSTDTVNELKDWLGSDLDRFRNEIFDGSEEGLRAALRDLGSLGSWGDAARYLQDDVFDRYRVDLFDDAAVDFTDRMQAWFEDVDQPRS